MSHQPASSTPKTDYLLKLFVVSFAVDMLFWVCCFISAAGLIGIALGLVTALTNSQASIEIKNAWAFVGAFVLVVPLYKAHQVVDRRLATTKQQLENQGRLS